MQNVEAFGVSPQLVRATIDQGSAAPALPFGSVIDSQWLVANMAIVFVCGAVLVLGGYAVYAMVIGSVWFNRNVLLGEKTYPQDTYLDVQYAQDNVVHIPRGDDWPLTIVVKKGSKAEPDGVIIDFVSASGRHSETMKPLDEKKRFRIELKNVIEPFQFLPAAPTAEARPTGTSAVVDRPSVTELKLTKTLPAYAGGTAEQLPPGTGPYYILAGSTLAIRGKANKPLSRAVGAGEKNTEMKIVGSDGFQLDIPADKLADAGYEIQLWDTEQFSQPGQTQPGPLESKHPTRFTIRVKPDRPPDVVAKLIGISGMVVPHGGFPTSAS